MTRVRKAIVTAAGRGTRQFPATKALQKELIPLVDTDGYTKPALQIIVEEALASGIEEVCIVANPSNVDALRTHFSALSAEQLSYLQDKPWAMELADSLQRIGESVSFVVQDVQEGYGHAVYQTKEWIGGEPFLLLLGDHLFMSPHVRCARQMLDAYARWECPISSVTPTPASLIHGFGAISGMALENDAYLVTDMQEKPTIEEARLRFQMPGLPPNHYLCFFGMHLFPPQIFECLEHLFANDIRTNNEFQLTAAQELLLARTERYVALVIDGKRYDLGIPEGLLQSQMALALASPYADTIRRMVYKD